jgi:hypothetical protein
LHGLGGVGGPLDVLRAAYLWLTSQDDVGNAIEDTVVGEYHSGFNWVVRGETTSPTAGSSFRCGEIAS